MPRKKIGFLKTHKCASTTVQNILLRYAIKHNLNVVLPETDANVEMSGDPMYHTYWNVNLPRNPISNEIRKGLNLKYDMFVLHTRWNHRKISRNLNDQGKNDVFYFSILREPVEAYRSFFDYFKLSNQYSKTLDEYAKTVIRKYVLYNNMTRRLPGYNQMFTDFGMHFNEMYKRNMSLADKKMITEELIKKLNEIDHTFDLILLADEDHFEDGIILLKHALCWEFEDIINVKRNTFGDHHPARPNIGPNTKSTLSDESRSIIKGTN